MIDGTLALKNDNLQLARRHFVNVLAAPLPYAMIDERIDDRVVLAAARLNLLYLATIWRDEGWARQLAAAARREDGPYAGWSEAFRAVSARGGDPEAACVAAKAAAADVGLPGYSYLTNPLGAAGALCAPAR